LGLEPQGAWKTRGRKPNYRHLALKTIQHEDKPMKKKDYPYTRKDAEADM